MTTAEDREVWHQDESTPSDFTRDDAELAGLRAEVERLRHQVDYYAGQRSDMEDVAGDSQGEAHRLGTKLLDETLRADREEARAEAAEAERDRLREANRRFTRRIDDGLRIVAALAEAVEDECRPVGGICHEHDLTDEGECPLLVDLERAIAALQGQSRAVLADAAPDPTPSAGERDREGCVTHQAFWQFGASVCDAITSGAVDGGVCRRPAASSVDDKAGE